MPDFVSHPYPPIPHADSHPGPNSNVPGGQYHAQFDIGFSAAGEWQGGALNAPPLRDPSFVYPWHGPYGLPSF